MRAIKTSPGLVFVMNRSTNGYTFKGWVGISFGVWGMWGGWREGWLRRSFQGVVGSLVIVLHSALSVKGNALGCDGV